MARGRLLVGDVVDFTGPTRVDIPPKDVIEGAAQTELNSVVVIGWDKDNNLFLAASEGSLAEILLLLEVGKKALLDDE